MLFLQETHTQPADEVDWKLWWKSSCAFSHGTNISAGVVVPFAPSSSAVLLSTVEVVKGRLLIVRANIDGTVFCFVNLYDPAIGAERVDLFTCLRDELVAGNLDQLLLGVISTVLWTLRLTGQMRNHTHDQPSPFTV